MSCFKKRVAWVLVICMVATTVILTPFGSSEVSATDTGFTGSAKEYSFRWADDDYEHDADAKCWYTDDYFKGDSRTYNASLATMSACFEMACFGSVELGSDADNPDWTKQAQNGKALLETLGFSKPSNNSDYNKKPTTRSIGVISGYKILNADTPDTSDDIPLIAVGIRGSNYKAEWAGNFDMGTSGNHAGFDSAADKTINYLQDYISEQTELSHYDKVKVWIVGYSRAAATANLTAAKINEDTAVQSKQGSVEGPLLGKKVEANDLYAYTFETPRGWDETNTPEEGTDNTNIFNIINPNDLVALVAPPSFGFKQYGINKILPAIENTENYQTWKKTKMFNHYADKDKYYLDPYKTWDIKMEEPYLIVSSEDYSGQSVFMNDFINTFATDVVKDRENFVKSYQGDLQLMFSLLMEDLSSAQASKLMDNIAAGRNKIWFTLMCAMLYSGHYDTAKIHFDWILENAFKWSDIKVSKEKRAKIVDASANVLYMLSQLWQADSKLTTTLVANQGFFNTVIQAHGLSLTKAWLETMDENYVSDSAERLDPDKVFLSGEYRKVTVAGEGVKAVLKKDGDVLAALDDNGLTGLGEGETPEVATGIDQNGQKIFYLPTDQEYKIEISGKAGTSYDYTVQEYNPSISSQPKLGNMKRLTMYIEDLPQSGTAIGEIPAFSTQEVKDGIPDGSKGKYEYTINGKNDPYQDLNLNQLSNQYCNVTVKENNGHFGVASGGGSVIKGAKAYLRAETFEDGIFMGWYDKDGTTLLSNDPEFAMRTKKDQTDVEVMAKFTYSIPTKDLKASNPSQTGDESLIVLDWTVPSESDYVLEDIAGYDIYRNGVKMASIDGAKNTEYIDKDDPVAGKEYAYTVKTRSKEIGGKVYQSSQYETSQVTAAGIVEAPAKVTAKNSSKDMDKAEVTLKWKAPDSSKMPAENIAGYKIYRDGIAVGDVDGAGKTSFVEKGLAGGKTYSYTVRTKSVFKDEYDMAVESQDSDPISIKVKNGDPKKGFVFSSNNGKYKVTKVGAKGQLDFVKALKKTYKKFTVAAAVKLNADSYKVTSIASKAFYNNKKLRTLTIKSSNITKIGSKAFKGVSSKLVVNVPNKQINKLKKLMRKAGLPKAVKVK